MFSEGVIEEAKQDLVGASRFWQGQWPTSVAEILMAQSGRRKTAAVAEDIWFLSDWNMHDTLSGGKHK